MFGHLHVVSSYSFQNSTIHIPSLVSRAKELGIQALALCDHHVMYGVMEFKSACEKAGIKPIYGLEVTVSLNNHEFPIVLHAVHHLRLPGHRHRHLRGHHHRPGAHRCGPGR